MMDAPRRERYLRIAQACEDYLAVSGGEGSGVEPHPATEGIYPDADAVIKREIASALDRMKDLFEPDVIESLQI